eukprot:25204_1
MSYDFLYGAYAAIVSKTIAAPMERVKLLLQTRLMDSNHSLTSIISRIFREQGLLSFWRGNMASIIRYFPLQAFMLSFKEQFKVLFVPQSTHASTLSIITGSILAGGTAGCSAITLIYPLDLSRTRLAVDMGARHREFTGIYNCLMKTYATGGLVSWYQGLGASYCCYFIYRGLQIGGYDAMKRIYDIDLRRKNTLLISVLLSYSISCGAMTVAYPLDTIRRKMMLQSGVTKQKRMYRNSIECWKDIVKRNGAKGLYKGLGVNYVRAFGSSLVLVLFDCLKTY